MFTQLKYTISGVCYCETVSGQSALPFNMAVKRILKIADKDSLKSQTVAVPMVR